MDYGLQWVIVGVVVLCGVSVVVSGCVVLILVVLWLAELAVGMRDSRVVVREVGCVLRRGLPWCQTVCVTVTPVGLLRTQGGQQAE